MAPYPETETMTLKRIEVAIKKRDWTLLSEGISKIREKFETNHHWEHSSQWRDLLLLAESARLPEDLWKTFCSMVARILENERMPLPVHNPATSSPTQLQEDSFEQKEQQINPIEQKQLSFQEDKSEKNPVETAPAHVAKSAIELDEPCLRDSVSIFYNEDLAEEDIKLIRAYRSGLESIMNGSDEEFPSKNWFNNLSHLCSSLNRANPQMEELLQILKDVKVKGSIVAASYSSSVFQTLLKFGINFSMPALKDSQMTSEHFKYFALGGLINSYVCCSCESKSLKTGSHFDAVTGCCKKCSSMLYPDICDISTSQALSSPKNWYQAFSQMSKSTVWVLLNPSLNSKPQVEEMLAYAAGEDQNLKRVYIISKNSEIATAWKNIIESKIEDVDVKDHYPTVGIFLNDFKEIEISKKTTVLA